MSASFGGLAPTRASEPHIVSGAVERGDIIFEQDRYAVKGSAGATNQEACVFGDVGVGFDDGVEDVDEFIDSDQEGSDKRFDGEVSMFDAVKYAT
jgi:hypothetical protein